MRTTLLPATRWSLIAQRFTTSGRYWRGSRHNQLPVSSRQYCPDVCSDQLVAFSGERAAA